jgi:hypothetical protein
MGQMNEPVAGPQPGDWVAATLRGLHPTRVIVCSVGVALTVLCLAVAQTLFSGEQIDGSGWWRQPIDQVRTFRDELTERSFLGATIRVMPLIGVITALWCLVGCWVARHELVARASNQSYDAPTTLEPGPTSLVIRQFKSLVICCPTALAILALCLFPIIAAGAINNWFGGPGAIIVAVILPVVLIFNLIVLCLAFGFLAWPLMPISIAAENSDAFDALSRCYNYAFTRPIRFILLTAIAIGLASIPMLIVMYPLTDVIGGLQPPIAQIVFWLAVALSKSIFWSLETLVYLHMRRAIDDVDANEIATGVANQTAESKPKPKMAETAARSGDSEPARPGSVLKRNVIGLIAVVPTWCLTVWLFRKLGGDAAGWMNWVLGGEIVPAAKGLYSAAALLALIWGVMWLGLPIYMTFRAIFRGNSESVESTSLSSEAANSP